jgi:iron uptake system component EfeO
VEENFAKVDATLATYREGDGFKTYDHLTRKDQLKLKGAITTLAEDLAQLRGTLGVE